MTELLAFSPLYKNNTPFTNDVVIITIVGRGFERRVWADVQYIFHLILRDGYLPESFYTSPL